MDSRKLEQLEKGINIIAFTVACVAIIATIAGCLNYAVITEQKFYIFSAFITGVIGAVLLITIARDIFKS